MYNANVNTNFQGKKVTKEMRHTSAVVAETVFCCSKYSVVETGKKY